MRSRATELARRVVPAVYYCAREASDARLDATSRAVLVTLGTDLLALTEAALDAMTSDDRDGATAHDLDRARQRLRAARDLGEMRDG